MTLNSDAALSQQAALIQGGFLVSGPAVSCDVMQFFQLLVSTQDHASSARAHQTCCLADQFRV
jgi:hypothetical protein